MIEIYIEQKRFKAALPYLEESLKKRPDNIEVLRNISGIYFHLQMWTKAVSSYQLIFSYEPKLKPP